MSNFIRLHNCENNTVVILDLNRVVCIDTDEVTSGPKGDKRTVSKIYLDSTTDIEEFQVNESPEKIYEMINSLKDK